MAAPGDACSGLSWTIDAWGNRTDQTVTGGTCNTFHAGVGTNNRLVSPYVYDAAGNLTSDGTHTYTYNAENQLIQVDGGSTATYLYDPEGKRVEKISGGVTLAYLYHPNGNLLAEVSSNGLQRGYIYENSRLVAEYENSTTYFIHADSLGSTRLVTGMAANIVDKMDYLPYGEQIVGSSTTSHKFTGKERDSESGLDNFGARYMSSSLGRFMTPDWSAAADSTPYADLTNPQSLNLYSYVKNNPLNLMDVDGHEDQEPEPEKKSPEEDAREDGEFDAKLERAERNVAEQEARKAEQEARNLANAHDKWEKTQTNGYDDPLTGICYASRESNPSTKPSNEPPQLAEGKEAHRNDPVRPTEKPEVTTPSGSGRMDRYDAQNAHIREIKPNNPRGKRSGAKQLHRYKKEMDKATGKDHSTELTLYNRKQNIH